MFYVKWGSSSWWEQVYKRVINWQNFWFFSEWKGMPRSDKFHWKGTSMTTCNKPLLQQDSFIWKNQEIPHNFNPPPLHGSLLCKSLISRMDWVFCAGDIYLPHTPFPPARSPPNKKIKYNKILTYILRSIFLEIPHLELLRWWKTPRDTNGKGV